MASGKLTDVAMMSLVVLATTAGAAMLEAGPASAQPYLQNVTAGTQNGTDVPSPFIKVDSPSPYIKAPYIKVPPFIKVVDVLAPWFKVPYFKVDSPRTPPTKTR
jgi:hypothetical protein